MLKLYNRLSDFYQVGYFTPYIHCIYVPWLERYLFPAIGLPNRMRQRTSEGMHRLAKKFGYDSFYDIVVQAECDGLNPHDFIIALPTDSLVNATSIRLQ